MTPCLDVRIAARLAAVAVLTIGVACGGTPAVEPNPSVSATPGESVYVATSTPVPRTTPPGTPAPIPTAALGASASVSPPPPNANATPSPTPDPAVWRLEGYVVDEKGVPLESVCVVIGPNGCQLWSPKTDERGHYFIDVAQGNTIFDIYFELPGHKTAWWKAIPRGPMQFNVILPATG